jgi:methylglutaconyl-CoA hydratase
MVYRTILVEDNPPVRTITLNRPERRNAMTQAMQSELIGAFEDTASSDCRVLILTGAGDAFCSGLDLSELQSLHGKTSSDHRHDAEQVARLFMTLYELPIPTIAAVQGAAIAGGTGLATICDLTLATSSAKFGFTEVRIGFVPALVSAFLSLQAGDKVCRDLLLTGRFFGADEAKRIGLVNEVVATDELMARAKNLAEALLANSPQSMRATKQLLASQNRSRLQNAITLALEVNEESRSTSDFHEGVSAFLEKRKPLWKK